MSIKDRYRVGRRVGQTRWQIKQAPGWRVVHQCDTLPQAAAWFHALGVNPSEITVLLTPEWLSLAKAIERRIA